MIEENPKWVVDLPDGRCAITLQTLVEYPEVARLVNRMSNYWKLSIDGDYYASPFPDELQ